MVLEDGNGDADRSRGGIVAILGDHEEAAAQGLARQLARWYLEGTIGWLEGRRARPGRQARETEAKRGAPEESADAH